MFLSKVQPEKTLVDLICGVSFAFSCISVPFRASELLVCDRYIGISLYRGSLNCFIHLTVTLAKLKNVNRHMGH